MQPTLQEIIDIAQKAGEILREGFGTVLNIRHKGRIDLVTEMDQHSEDFILSRIKQHYPDDSILTEESGEHGGLTDHCWYIDPLDGTVNYSHALPIYSISIAYAENQQMKMGVVVDPSRNEVFSAERGKGAWLNGKRIHVTEVSELVNSLLITGFPYDTEAVQNNLDNFARFYHEVQAVRRFGSACLDICCVAAGRVDGYWHIKSQAWDIAAATLILQEAGGLVTNLQGEKEFFKPPYCIVAANPHIHPKMLKVLHNG